jgi:rod shape-determining protein MreD
MNNIVVTNSIRFIILLLGQIVIFNNINLLGYIVPYTYTIYIIVFPTKNNRMVLLITAFLLGLLIDMFLDSGGIHAGACVFLAYVRPIFLKFSFGTLYDHQTIKFGNMEIMSITAYVALATIFHHLILFSLEIFNISQILLILKKTLFSSLFTSVFSVLLIILFRTRQ